MNRLLTVIFATVLLSGCAVEIPAYESSTAHYRTIERFDRVEIEVSADSGLGDLADLLAKELDFYLSQNGIRTSADFDQGWHNDAARLAVRVFRDLVSNPYGYRDYQGDNYRLEVRLTDASGARIDIATLHHRAGLSGPAAVAQQLAMLVADDMLFIWHPAPEAVGELWGYPKHAPFSLLADHFDQNTESPTLSWEAFPSERILAGSGISAEEITDVSYEFRLHRSGPYTNLIKVPFTGDKIYSFSRITNDENGIPKRIYTARAESGVFRVEGLTEPVVDIPFAFPSCEFALWSVRAHFRLRGYWRVTEWAGRYSTQSVAAGKDYVMPPYHYRRNAYSLGLLEHQIGGGTIFPIRPVGDVSCKDLGYGFIMPQLRANTDSVLQLDALEPGQSVAAISTVSEVCEDGDCAIQESVEETSAELRRCLAKEIDRRPTNTPVHDLSKLLAELPVSPEQVFDFSGHNSLLTLLRDPDNKDYLTGRGIRYVVNSQMSLQQGEKQSEFAYNTPDLDAFVEGDFDSIWPVGAFSSETKYASQMETSVIDVESGEVLDTTISSSAEGTKGVIVPVIVIIPVAYIPYGSRAKIERKACAQMARTLSVAFRGIVLGWPSEYFDDVYDPLWQTDRR